MLKWHSKFIFRLLDLLGFIFVFVLGENDFLYLIFKFGNHRFLEPFSERLGSLALEVLPAYKCLSSRSKGQHQGGKLHQAA